MVGLSLLGMEIWHLLRPLKGTFFYSADEKAEVLDIEATVLHPDPRNLGGENYVVGFEGEIEVGAETKELAENQANDLLSHLGQITVVAFKEKEE
jgi:hypothetical protein